MKNRETGKFPGNSREMPGNFLDFGTTEKWPKIIQNSRFPGFPAVSSRFPGWNFLVSRNQLNISRFPGFSDSNFPTLSRVHDLQMCSAMAIVPIRWKIYGFSIGYVCYVKIWRSWQVTYGNYIAWRWKRYALKCMTLHALKNFPLLKGMHLRPFWSRSILGHHG